MAFKFPFTNYHELNLDWILKKVETLSVNAEADANTIATYEERLQTAETQAQNAETSAANAQTAATSAASVAENALTTANSAQSSADASGALASQAATKADAAQIAADNARQAAETAQATAANFDGRITSAEQNASEALNMAQSFDEQARAAITTANNAANVATEAQAQANTTALELARQRTELETIGAAQVSRVEDKGAEVLESIPADYTALTQEVSDLNRTIEEVTEETRNLFNLDMLYIGKAWNGSANSARACVYIPFPGSTSYVITIPQNSFDLISVFEKESVDATGNLYSSGVSDGFTRTSNANTHYLCLQFNKTAVSASDFEGLQIQVEIGTVKTPFINSKTAIDFKVRNESITYVTPEQFGAWGDGVHDDTAAIQAALNTGKDVYAPNKYKITASISMNPLYPTGQRFDFGSLICTSNETALKFNGRCGNVNGFYIESQGNCISFGEAALTYDWNVNIAVLNSTSGACAQYGGGSGNVSEIRLSGERYNYTTVGINILPVGGFVGQISFDNMTFITEAANGGYAFNANGASYPMTGLTCFNVSLEGAHGGFQFVNSQVSTPINPVYCFGLRTSELTVVNGYKLIRLTGNGIIAGDIFCDIFTLDSIDVALHKPDITLEQSLNFHGRISGYGRGWRNVRIVGNAIFPTWNEEYAGNVLNPTYNDSNLPYTVNLFSGSASWTVDFPFDGSVTFISTADGSTLAINGTTVTMNNTQRCVVRTVADQTSIHVMVLRPNGTEIPLNLATT